MDGFWVDFSDGVFGVPLLLENDGLFSHFLVGRVEIVEIDQFGAVVFGGDQLGNSDGPVINKDRNKFLNKNWDILLFFLYFIL